MKTALVVGGLGIVGQGMVRELAQRDDWRTVALSRRTPAETHGAQFVQIDLLDRAACEAVLPPLGEISHIFYVAYQERATFAEEVAPNLAMLRNVVEVVEANSPALAHVSLMQGTKAYGVQFGAFKTPARETDPRHMPPNFYYDQEDFLKAASVGKAWSWSGLRPRSIYGHALKSPMNLMANIAVYAALSKELGLPLRFPGTHAGYRRIEQAVDTGLLARAAIWAATEPACAGEIFNVTNGGHFRWEHMWPFIAECFGMKAGPVQTISLARHMPDKGPLWDAMVARHGLAPNRLEDVVDWRFGDFQWHADHDSLVETTKIRRFGFHEIVDDEEMFSRLIREMRERRVIP